MCGDKVIARIPDGDGVFHDHDAVFVRSGRDGHGIYTEVILADGTKRRLHRSLVKSVRS